MTCRIEVFVRSGHTIDLALEDGEDREFTTALHQAWASPESIGEFTCLALGENAVVSRQRGRGLSAPRVDTARSNTALTPPGAGNTRAARAGRTRGSSTQRRPGCPDQVRPPRAAGEDDHRGKPLYRLSEDGQTA